MSRSIAKKQIEALVDEYAKAIPNLAQELEAKLQIYTQPTGGNVFIESPFRFNNKDILPDLERITSEAPAVLERVIALQAGARPVARIRNNKATTEFLGPDSESWGDIIREYQKFIDDAIPAVGRIELKNSDISWVGTGWLIEEDIIVTNRHVADDFARKDPESSQFVFLPGLLPGPVTTRIDFLEEESRLDSAEHSITSILWQASADEADVAFLRITRTPGVPMPNPIQLADDVTVDTLIAAIGYPARDPRIRDQELVISIFGDDVYEKKRLAPGRLKGVEGPILTHDCSTLGGNSGSVLLDIKTGKAVGIHYGGLADDSANLGVTISHIKMLLGNAIQQETFRHQPTPAPSVSADKHSVTAVNTPETYQIKLNIPIEISVRIGSPFPANSSSAYTPAINMSTGDAVEAALSSATQQFSLNPNVLEIRRGYRFKNGWITDEPVIAIIVRQKLAFGAIRASGTTPFPREILGVGVDVRTASLPLQLRNLKVDLNVPERRGRMAGYKEPPGYKDPHSDMYLTRITDEEIDAVFHVSPDAGFANLKSFFGRIKRHLSATMYEWEPNHISDVLEEAMQPDSNTLLMVTQKKDFFGKGDNTEKAVLDMQQRIGTKFKHVWASVRGPRKLFPSAYHIKVASRDGEEVWLSSGNWTSSNQPENASNNTILRDRNREWHAIISNKRLATLFQNYIEYDFREATRFPLEENENMFFPEMEFFISLEEPQVAMEKVPGVTYEDELIIRGEKLDIQPLLTPDRDENQIPMFMKVATEMIQRATKSIYLQNQSFKFTNLNNAEFDRFFQILKEKQQTINDVRIIFRDAKDYRRPSDLEDQQGLIERLKNFGFKVSPQYVKLQSKCHNKGIIVDSKEVLIGSHNLTNEGSLFNRDASLLIRSPKVADFYEKIFLYDWQHLAHNNADERVIRRARPGEETPVGFRRVKLSEILKED